MTGATARSDSGLARVSSLSASLPYTARRSVAVCWTLRTPLPIQSTTNATNRKVATKPTISSGSMLASHVDVDDLAQPEDATGHEDNAYADGYQPESLLEKRADVVRIGGPEEPTEPERQRSD